MTKAEKRIAIAKDVLAQIKIKKLIPMRGVYGIYSFTSDTDYNSDARDAINSDNFKRCDACALGAALLSFVRLYDGMTVGELKRADPEWRLRNVFGAQQLNTIEAAFERWPAGERFQPEVVNSSDRLVAIMRNIVRNKGTFKLPAR